MTRTIVFSLHESPDSDVDGDDDGGLDGDKPALRANDFSKRTMGLYW